MSGERQAGRTAFLMELKPGCEAVYEARHDEIWPELVGVLHRYGIHNYSIYRHGLQLFAYLEADDLQKLASLPGEPALQRWWRSMEPLMRCNADASPVQTTLVEVFHLE